MYTTTLLIGFAVTATARASLSCPGSDGSYFTASSGVSYKVECGVDHVGGDMPSSPVWVSTLDDCIAACDSTSGCVDVSWVPGTPGACYMKSSVQSASANSGVWGAVRTDNTCESIDGISIAISEDTLYTVECGKDRIGGDMPNSPVWTSDFNSCLAACESNPGCIDVSYIPSSPNQGPCYMKNSLQPAFTNTHVWGAKRSSICPDLDGTTYQTSCGSTYQIQCYVDHFGGLLDTVWTSSLKSCISACDTATGCVDVSYAPGTPGPCYLKNFIGAASNNTGILGAKQLTACTS